MRRLGHERQSKERSPPRQRQESSCGRRRRRQLRLVAGAGRALLPRRVAQRLRAGADARGPWGLSHPRHRVRRRVRHRQEQSRARPLRGHIRKAQQHREVRGRAARRREGPARHDPRRHRQVPLRSRAEGARRNLGRSRHPEEDEGRRDGQLPAGRLRRGDQVVRRAGTDRGRGIRQLHPGLHRARAVLAEAFPRQESADHRRRHQIAGRRDHHPPRPDPPVPRPRREARAHLPAQLRWQHRLPEHARARAPDVQEDLQDSVRHVTARLRHRQRQRAHRPVGLRALAERPQVGLHPARRALVRRRAAERRAQARGGGLAELGRNRHRCCALRQAGARPRSRWSARGTQLLLHEVAAGAVQRQRRQTAGGGVHRR